MEHRCTYQIKARFADEDGNRELRACDKKLLHRAEKEVGLCVKHMHAVDEEADRELDARAARNDSYQLMRLKRCLRHKQAQSRRAAMNAKAAKNRRLADLVEELLEREIPAEETVEEDAGDAAAADEQQP